MEKTKPQGQNMDQRHAGVGDCLQRDKRKLFGVVEMFYDSIMVEVTWLYVLIKIQRNMHLNLLRY